MHSDDDFCPHIQAQIREHPEWLTEATDALLVSGEYDLITTNKLDSVVQTINSVLKTDFKYEGTRQFSRDIQVFKRLNEESFSASGVFSTPNKAKAYLAKALAKDATLKANGVSDGRKFATPALERKLIGAGHEVDWLRTQAGKATAIYKKSTLLNGNAPGIDGTTSYRLTGKIIDRTTIKASVNPIDKNSTGIRGITDAIKKGTATENDIIFGPEGMAAAARDAGLKNPVVEKYSPDEIRNSVERLKRKILDGKAVTTPTIEHVGEKMGQGSFIGAAVELTVSCIVNYARYKTGEITGEEAFREIGESTAKGALVGGALSSVTIFLPEGILGFTSSLVIGIYINDTTRNILDEVFGKGFFEQTLHAAGYVFGVSVALQDALAEMQRTQKRIYENFKEGSEAIATADKNIDEILSTLGGKKK